MVGLSHGEILDSDKLIQHEAKKGKTMTPSEASDQFLAMAFIENANSSRYNLLWRELTNGISMKKDLYPKTLAEAVHLLTHWKGTPNKNVRLERGGPRSSHISFHQNSVEPLMTPEIQRFLQPDGTVAGSDGRVQSSVTCFRCHKCGHYATSCSTLTSENGTFSDFCFAQGSGTLSPTLLIIDTGSTFNSFSNRRLLENITKCDGIRAYSNGGHLDYYEAGTIHLFPALRAFTNPKSLANIISYSELSKYYRVVVDTLLWTQASIFRSRPPLSLPFPA